MFRVIGSVTAVMAASGGLLFAMPAHAQASLDEVVVTGRKIEHYQATDALTGTKSNALLRDLPITVSVVPHQLVEDRAIVRLGEALDNVPGAQRKQGYGGVENFGAFLRGFDASFLTLRNGIRDYGFYTLRDTANVERFEVLKGPGSVLYGAVYPGGITNTISKKPLATPLAQINVMAGSHDRYRGDVDLGGPLTDALFYRLNVAYEDADSFRDETGNKAFFVAPVVTWVISDRTSLTAEIEHKDSEYSWDLGLPRHPLSLQVPVSRFLGEPDGTNKVKSTYANTRLVHQFSDGWKLRQVLSYAKTDGDYGLRSAFSITGDGRTANRVAYDTWEKSHTLVAQHEIVGEFTALGASHNLVTGIEYYETQQSYSFFFSGLASIDLFEPVYGAQPEPGGFVLFADKSESKATGFYVQDLVSVAERWKLLLGARYDRVKYQTTNLMNGTTTRRSPDDALSPQVGVVFQPDEATSLHLSYGESFVSVTSGRTASGEDLKPESGQQIEMGLRHIFLGGRLSSSLALYEIHRQNVSTPDPVTPTFRVQTAEQRSRGAELELSGRIIPGWDVIAGASYIDAEVTEDNTFAVGSRLPGAPRYSVSLWSKYGFQRESLAGLELGAGVYYVDERAVALPNPVWTLPSYVRFDAMAAYAFDNWRMQLNVKNLADRRIYDLSSSSIMPQETRSVLVSASYTF